MWYEWMWLKIDFSSLGWIETKTEKHTQTHTHSRTLKIRLWNADTYSESMRFVRRYENQNVFDGIDHAANGMGCMEVFLYSRALHICWKHEEHEEHQQCWFKCRYNEHWKCAQRTDTYFGMSVNAIVLRQTFISWSLYTGDFFDLPWCCCCFFCSFSVCIQRHPVDLFIFAKKLVARFSIPMNRHYITRPQRRQDRRKKHIPKERKRSFRMS